MNIVIQESLLSHEIIAQMRTIFMSYFMNLYQNMPATISQINGNLEEYLLAIFDKNIAAINAQQRNASFAFIEQNMCGFALHELLPQSTTILLCTLPVHPQFHENEPHVREKLIKHIGTRYPQATKIVTMIRHANSLQRDLCLQMGFTLYNEIFGNVPDIKEHYQLNCYNGYMYNISK